MQPACLPSHQNPGLGSLLLSEARQWFCCELFVIALPLTCQLLGRSCGHELQCGEKSLVLKVLKCFSSLQAGQEGGGSSSVLGC